LFVSGFYEEKMSESKKRYKTSAENLKKNVFFTSMVCHHLTWRITSLLAVTTLLAANASHVHCRTTSVSSSTTANRIMFVKMHHVFRPRLSRQRDQHTGGAVCVKTGSLNIHSLSFCLLLLIQI